MKVRIEVLGKDGLNYLEGSEFGKISKDLGFMIGLPPYFDGNTRRTIYVFVEGGRPVIYGVYDVSYGNPDMKFHSDLFSPAEVRNLIRNQAQNCLEEPKFLTPEEGC